MQWSIDAAATEFQIDRRTLTKRLKDAGHAPGRGVTFTTWQIIAAINTDVTAEVIDGEAALARLNDEKADEVAMRNAKERMELLHAADLIKRIGPVLTDLIATIEASPLSDEAKDSIRAKLAAAFDVKSTNVPVSDGGGR